MTSSPETAQRSAARTGAALHAEARRAIGAGQAQTALRLARRAVKECGSADPARLVAALVTLGSAELQVHGPSAARERLAQARRVARRALNDPEGSRSERGAGGSSQLLPAPAHRQPMSRTESRQLAPADLLAALAHAEELEGVILGRSGDFSAALPHFDEALSLGADPATGPRDPLDADDRAAMLLNRGTTHLFLGHLAEARADLFAASRLAARAGSPRLQFKATHNLGYADFLAGDLPVALAEMAEADALEVEVSRSVALLDRARVLMEAGLLEDADASLTRAVELIRAERANAELGPALLAQAEVALLSGKLDQADAVTTIALRLFRRRHDAGWAARAELARAQVRLARDARPGSILSTVERLRGDGALGEDEVLSAAARLLAAQALARLGRFDEARAQLVPSGRNLPLTLLLQTQSARAEVEAADGHPAQARRAVRTGWRLLAQAQARHASVEVRAAMTVHAAGLARTGLRLALSSARRDRARHAFEVVECWRGLSQTMGGVRPPSDPVIAELTGELRITAEALRAARPGADTTRARAQRASLESRIRARQWQIGARSRDLRPVSFDRAREAAAAAGMGAVLHVVLDDRLIGVVVGAGRAQLLDLGDWTRVLGLQRRVRADLDALAQPFVPEQLRSAVRTTLTRSLEALDELVLPEQVTGLPIVVIPSKALSVLPWSLLPSRRGLPTLVAPSMSTWVGRRENANADADAAVPPARPPRVVAVAGPRLRLAVDEVRQVTATWQRVGQGPRQLGATDEAAAVHGHPDGMAAADLAAAMSSADLVHLAAHGRHVPDNPLFASLEVADGPLFAYDLPTTGLPGHIVLSACELGLSTPRHGGDSLGLTTALLSLGAGSVIAAVGRVGDEVAYRVMLDYHERLARGVDSATALAQVLAESVESGHSAPFVNFGAAWTATGTG